MPEHRLKKNRLIDWISDPIFDLGIGLLVGAGLARAASADRPIIVIFNVVFPLSWLLLAVSLHRLNLFSTVRNSRKRRCFEGALQLVFLVIMMALFIRGPWMHFPRLMVTKIDPFFVMQKKGWNNVYMQNQSWDPATGFEYDFRLKLLPFKGVGARTEDYQTLEAVAAKEIFDDLDNSKLLSPQPPTHTTNPWEKFMISPRTDEEITDEQQQKYANHQLLAFFGGRVLYSDSNGCVYQTEFFGFSEVGSQTAFGRFHQDQAVKLPRPCRP